MSPKSVSKVIKSPTQPRKPFTESMPDPSQALNTNKRLKVLIESDHSDIDSPTNSTTSSSQTKRNKRLRNGKNEKRSEKGEPAQHTDSTRIHKSPIPSTSAVTTSPEDLTKSENLEISGSLPWTREEDKYILEEQRKGYNNELELVSRLKEGLVNRTTSEVTKRFEFLMDLLKKIQQKT